MLRKGIGSHKEQHVKWRIRKLASYSTRKVRRIKTPDQIELVTLAEFGEALQKILRNQPS